MLQIINNNAYRMLGVTATAPMKDMVRNKSMFNAFLRVNRPIPDQLIDFPQLLGDFNRNLETITNAESEISIPSGQVANGMFWFVGTSNLDDECFQYIANGDIKGAIGKWRADGKVSSLQNILVCMLIEERYKEAMLLAQNLYTVHFDKWREMYSLLADISSLEVSHMFLDRLYLENPKGMCSMNWDGISNEWESYTKKKSTSPISDNIISLVEECHNSNRENSKLRYKEALNMLDKVQPLLKELEGLLKHDDIILVSMEDKVYSEALNCSIASYNAAYDNLNHGDDVPYRQIAPKCKELMNRISSNFVSPAVAKRIEDNRNIINENCSDIEKTVEEHLAFNNQICWFCGAYGNTQEYKKPYSYSISTPTWNGTKTTTYTKTVKLHICDECLKELDEQRNWNLYTAGASFIVIFLIFLIGCDFWTEFGFWGWVISIGVIGTLSICLGLMTGKGAREKLSKQIIREFKRDVDDHPLVKMVKAEGYR